jgi:acylglycerol lipase
MNHIEGNFHGVRNTEIYYQAWLPGGEAKAVLLFVHGMGSHSGRYSNIVDPLVPRGIAVYGFDQIGHGKSSGERGTVKRFEDFTDTLAVYREKIKSEQTGKPVFLFGHSLGGLIAADYLLDHQADFRGAILSAPAVKVGENISPARILIGRILSVIAPRAGVMRLDPAGLSHDPAVVEAYLRDPLVFHGRIPARLAAEMLKAMRRVAAEAHRITLPLLTFQGGAEKTVNSGGARMLYERAGSVDKSIKIYEGLYHETFNEPERARVLEDMRDWLEAQIGPDGGHPNLRERTPAP